MGVGVLYGVITGLVILICSPISYFILQKSGRKKSGIVVATILALIVIIPFLSIVLEGTFYSKTDVIADLKLANLKLDDNFEIISNKVTGIPERYQYTELKLAARDIDRIISEIKNGKNFRRLTETRMLYNEMWNEKNIRNKVIFTDYLLGDKYTRESYYRHDDYVPILMIVSLKANSDTLAFERIEE
jgi:hypothetical protein